MPLVHGGTSAVPSAPSQRLVWPVGREGRREGGFLGVDCATPPKSCRDVRSRVGGPIGFSSIADGCMGGALRQFEGFEVFSELAVGVRPFARNIEDLELGTQRLGRIGSSRTGFVAEGCRT